MATSRRAGGEGRQPATSFVPVTLLITAGVDLVASLATFVLLKERAVPQSPGRPAQAVGGAIDSLRHVAGAYKRGVVALPDLAYGGLGSVFVQGLAQ